MSFENLPAVVSKKTDGNLPLTVRNDDPVTFIIGTAARGDSETPYVVNSVSDAANEFGKDNGTLIRGLYEAREGGASNVRLYRIGASSAMLENVGGGITIETMDKDDSAGGAYNLFWDDTAKRLRIWRASDDLLIYDNNPTYPAGAVDENEVSVTGTSSGSPGDIGTLAAPFSLAAADGVSGASYDAGSDGINLSRMELYEALYEAYEIIENEDMDVVFPVNIYLDDLNVTDMTTAEVATLNASAPWDVTPVYPTAGDTAFDALGEVFVQEYEGSYLFWWDMDRDGIAEIFPSEGAASATTDADGNALSSSDFHEVNLAYQLANFCYVKSENDREVVGTVAVKPPASWAPKDVSNWIGELPTFTTANNITTVDVNGSGLLGNRWMAGRRANIASGLPAHTVGGTAGLAYGGFIATDDGWLDGTQLEDVNDHLVDIGKYISVFGSYGVLSNPTASNAYSASGVGIYGGFITARPSISAPTNKIIPGIRLPFRISNSKLDDLAGLRYVMLREKPKGTVVADAPTAARPDSDYQRLSTVLIVKDVIDSIRAVSDPFLGEALNATRFAGLDTAIERALEKNKKAELLTGYQHNLYGTPQDRVLGKAYLDLVLVPAFELRELTVTVALSAS
jgi:hypothetical protein